MHEIPLYQKKIHFKLVGFDLDDIRQVHTFFKEIGFTPINIKYIVKKNKQYKGKYGYYIKQYNLYDFDLVTSGEELEKGVV